MSLIAHCLPPSSSLPPIRSLLTAPSSVITSALHNLRSLYCPLRIPLSLVKTRASDLALVDSGYASRDESEDAVDVEDALAALRSDDFEKAFAVRWLTGLIGRAEELAFEDEEEREKVIGDAAFILASFSENTAEDIDESLTREFSFPTLRNGNIDISLNDAPLSGVDHTDVGLQSWGASIIISGLMCEDPARFSLDELREGANVIELGAGTGLVSLTLAKLLPSLSKTGMQIVATDYHPTVLENLKANIATNFAEVDKKPQVRHMLLDWSLPPAHLWSTSDMLFAADVVYAPEHAIWLRDCAGHLLLPHGIFWLIVTVRKAGKFEGIPDTAEAAFLIEEDLPEKQGKKLRVVEKTELEKKRGIGRGDEYGYMLFKIMWV